MKSTNKYMFYLFILLTVLSANRLNAQTLTVNIELPVLKTIPYHKPYVAVWVETKKRKGIHTLAFWKEQADWFKDLRQWWRKIGRNNTPNYDGVSGATKKPGKYTLTWDGTLVTGEKVTAGEYVLHIEAVREQGSREYLRQRFILNNEQTQTYVLQGKRELGDIRISIN